MLTGPRQSNCLPHCTSHCPTLYRPLSSHTAADSASDRGGKRRMGTRGRCVLPGVLFHGGLVPGVENVEGCEVWGAVAACGVGASWELVAGSPTPNPSVSVCRGVGHYAGPSGPAPMRQTGPPPKALPVGNRVLLTQRTRLCSHATWQDPPPGCGLRLQLLNPNPGFIQALFRPLPPPILSPQTCIVRQASLPLPFPLASPPSSRPALYARRGNRSGCSSCGATRTTSRDAWMRMTTGTGRCRCRCCCCRGEGRHSPPRSGMPSFHAHTQPPKRFFFPFALSSAGSIDLPQPAAPPLPTGRRKSLAG